MRRIASQNFHLPVEMQQHALRNPSTFITVHLFAVAIETERTALGKIIQCFS